MTFTTGTLTRCTGNNHYALPVTIAGVTKPLRTTLAEFQQDPPASLEDAREAIMDRLRSKAKEENASTFAQFKTALENQTLKV